MKKLKPQLEIRNAYIQINNEDKIVFPMRFYSYFDGGIRNVKFLLINPKTYSFIPVCCGNDEHLRGYNLFNYVYKAKYNLDNFYSVMFFNSSDVILLKHDYELQIYLKILEICKNEKSLLQDIVFIDQHHKQCTVNINNLEKLEFVEMKKLSSKGEEFFELLKYFLYFYNSKLNFSYSFQDMAKIKYKRLLDVSKELIEFNDNEFSFENVLGINGIKNKVHIAIKDVLDDGNFDNFNKLKLFFGNVKYARERIESF